MSAIIRQDDRWRYPTFNREPGMCRLLVVAADDQRPWTHPRGEARQIAVPPVVAIALISEREDNPSASVTNSTERIMEQLAREVSAWPLALVEHYGKRHPSDRLHPTLDWVWRRPDGAAAWTRTNLDSVLAFTHISARSDVVEFLGDVEFLSDVQKQDADAAEARAFAHRRRKAMYASPATRRATPADHATIGQHGYRVTRFYPAGDSRQGWSLQQDGEYLMIGGYGHVSPTEWEAVAEALKRIAQDERLRTGCIDCPEHCPD